MDLDKDFLQEQNKLIDDIPNKILEKAKSIPYSVYLSNLEYSNSVGIVETIYATKVTSKYFEIQKIVVVPLKEEISPILRNCYYSSYGCCPGFHVYGFKQKDSRWYDYMPLFDFADKTFPFEKIYRHEVFGLEEIVNLDNQFKFCGYQKMSGVYAIDFLRLYKKYPVAESIAKLKLERFINEKALAFITENHTFLKYLHKFSEDIREKNISFQVCKNAWKRNKEVSPVSYSQSLRYRCECGKELANIAKGVYEKVLKNTTQEKLVKYIKDKNISSSLYNDYIVACDWLGLDLSDTKVLFPKDFHKWHDEYTKQYARYKSKEKEKENQELNKKLNKIAKKYSFIEQEKDFFVILAKSKEDLIYEGEVLKHCVGRMNYDTKILNGKSLICFIRKKIDEPYLTCELKVGENKLDVVQLYGINNTLPMEEEITQFKKDWLKRINKVYKEKTA